MIHENTSDAESGEFSLVFRRSSLKEPHCSGRWRQPLCGLHSVKNSLFQKLLKSELWPSMTAILVLCGKPMGTFQRHSNTGGKFKVGWPLAKGLPLFYSSNEKGIWNDVPSNVNIKRHRWLLASGCVGSFNPPGDVTLCTGRGHPWRPPFKAYLEHTFQMVIDNTTRRHLGHLRLRQYQHFVQHRPMGLFLAHCIMVVAVMISKKDWQVLVDI